MFLSCSPVLRMLASAMRRPRLKARGDLDCAYYHCVSRVVNRALVFGPHEKEVFRRMVREYAAFCGVRVLTFCLMSNHFHLLLAVPRRPENALTDEELIERVRALYGPLTAES